MTGSINPPNPLSYEGQVAVPFINRTFPPQSTFNQFPIPTVWVDTSSSDAFVLVSKAAGVAVWAKIGGIPGSIDSITTPDSTVVVPTSGNINFLNGSAMSITGSGSDITFTVSQTITTPDSTVVTPVSGNINFLNGTGMNITGSGANVTFTSGQKFVDWSVITTTPQSIVAFNGYITNLAGRVDFTLPATAAVGDIFIITTIHADGFQVNQNAGQTIQLGDVSTTTGVGGSIRSTAIGDSISVVCTVANTDFLVFSMVGNIEYA